jgi:predicted AAA+ superfamily ATPase
LAGVLENAVFLHLRRKYQNIYYFREDNDCDFIVKEKNKAVLAVPVCYCLNDDNMNREIDGLKEALRKTRAEKGLIITFDQETRLEI